MCGQRVFKNKIKSNERDVYHLLRVCNNNISNCFELSWENFKWLFCLITDVVANAVM